ncbi:unnamed protein product [Prunus armeniaca]
MVEQIKEHAEEAQALMEKEENEKKDKKAQTHIQTGGTKAGQSTERVRGRARARAFGGRAKEKEKTVEQIKEQAEEAQALMEKEEAEKKDKEAQTHIQTEGTKAGQNLKCPHKAFGFWMMQTI